LNGSIILATGKINDVYYIIFCSIIFIEPLPKTHQPFGVSPMGILKVLDCLGSVDKLMRLPVGRECKYSWSYKANKK
jgi:hypothetical protein